MRNEECVNYQSLSHLNLINFFFSFSLLNAFNPVKSLRDNGAGARTRFSQRLTRQGRKLVNLSKQSAYKLTQETTSTSSTRLRFFLLICATLPSFSALICVSIRSNATAINTTNHNIFSCGACRNKAEKKKPAKPV